MKRMLFVGADLGTTGIKAGVVDHEGNILSSAYWPTSIVSDRPGHMQQSADDFLDQTSRILREVLQKSGADPSEIQAVAIDGQMGGIIGIDRSFRPLTGLDMGLDTESEPYNEILHRTAGVKLRSVTFGSPRNTAKIIWWMTKEHGTYRRVEKFVTLAGFVTGRMAGLTSEQAYIDYTSLAFFGNEDAGSLTWSSGLTRLFDLDIDKFPRVVEPWNVVGTVSNEFAVASGLVSGTPIMAGAGDQPAGLLGAGITTPGMICEVSGSSTLAFQCVPEYRPDREKGVVMHMPAVLPGLFYAFTYINGGGMALNWLSNELGLDTSEGFDSLSERSGAIPPGSDGLLFIPYFGGRQCPYNARLRGAFMGLNWGHHQEHLFRAILEGLAYDLAINLKRIRTLYPEMLSSEIVSLGGGSASRLWTRIKADVTGLTFRPLDGYEHAILGCAKIAQHGIGMPNAFSARGPIPPDATSVFVPSDETFAAYQPYVDVFALALSLPFQEVAEKLSRIGP